MVKFALQIFWLASREPYMVRGGERGIRTLDPVLSGILA